MNLTHEDVKRLTDKDVEKYNKRYQTFIGSKTTESLIGSMVDLYAYAASAVLNIKDVDRLKEDLKKDFTISKELTVVAGSLALKFGSFLALANTALITARHINFEGPQQLLKTNVQQSAAISEHSSAISEHSPAISEHSSAISEHSPAISEHFSAI